jgi:hypothetical protein
VLALAVDEGVGAVARDAQHELPDARAAGLAVDRDEVVVVGDGAAQTSQRTS